MGVHEWVCTIGRARMFVHEWVYMSGCARWCVCEWECTEVRQSEPRTVVVHIHSRNIVRVRVRMRVRARVRVRVRVNKDEDGQTLFCRIIILNLFSGRMSLASHPSVNRATNTRAYTHTHRHAPHTPPCEWWAVGKGGRWSVRMVGGRQGWWVVGMGGGRSMGGRQGWWLVGMSGGRSARVVGGR